MPHNHLGLGIALLFATLPLVAADWPGKQWESVLPAAMGLDEANLTKVKDYALAGGGSGCIIYRGKRVLAWGSQSELYDLKSTSKSIGVTLLGVAMKDGKVRLDDPAKKHHPNFGIPPEANAATGWVDGITLRMLADQTAGFDKPGGYQPLLFRPGTAWSYSDSGPNWLADCLTMVYGRDLNTVIFDRVFTPLGITADDIVWRKHAYRPAMLEGIKRREFGSGFSAHVAAMARLGYLYLRDGWWEGEQILPPEFLKAIRHADPALKELPVQKPEDYGKASAHYSLLWWNNADGTIAGLPRDAYWSWGLHDSLIVVVPSLDLVAARAGQSWQRSQSGDHYDVLRPFLESLAAAIPRRALYPPSPVIAGIDWAPPEAIIRLAKGSDNWPMTWADDDQLYTAYGDGNGFAPFVEQKLSLGFARITGNPPRILGENLHSADIEARGDGKHGRKASGLLAVDGTLYLWARNVGNAQLAWSNDRGKRWTWADWKLSASFGCPSFINFGRAYAGARDNFVYVCSHDAETAYDRADRFVLARVPKDRLARRDAYEFFVALSPAGEPVWSMDISRRGAVFSNPGNCYRAQMSYNAGLQRYLWCQTQGSGDTQFSGGLTICDAPEPWGPWTVAYQTPHWDVGPGDTCGLPTKWIGTDGRTVHLVFSGDDHFSVRRGVLKLQKK